MSCWTFYSSDVVHWRVIRSQGCRKSKIKSEGRDESSVYAKISSFGLVGLVGVVASCNVHVRHIKRHQVDGLLHQGHDRNM